MAELTLELLDALLSPTQNAKAEEYYQSIPLIRRISSLVQLLQGLQLTTPQDSTNGSSSFQSQSMLACVLLRRNIQSLGGAIAINDTVAVEGLANVGQAVDLCKGVVEALLTMWGQGTWNKPVKRQMGFVLAEATSTLLLMDEGTSGDVVNLILGNIAPACANGDQESLQLLSSLAQRSPLSLYKTKGPELSTLLLNATNNLLSSSTSTTKDASLHTLHSLLEALTYIVIASNTTLPPSTLSSKERIVHLIQAQTFVETDAKKLKLDPNSHATQFGQINLVPILTYLTNLCSTTTLSDSQQEVLCHCMELLMTAASHVPSFLAGTSSLLSHVVSTLHVIAKCPLDTSTRLSALEALTTLLNVPNVKLAIAQDGTGSIQHILIGTEAAPGILQICTELMVQGWDDDVQSWSTEPLALEDSTWEGDEIALHAQAILATVFSAVGGKGVPLTLQLVEGLVRGPWTEIVSGLVLLELLVEGSRYALGNNIVTALEMALDWAGREDLRVQFQALQLLGVVCHADTSAEIRSKFGQGMLQVVARAVASPCSRISVQACLVLVSFCRGDENGEASMVESAHLLPFLGDILGSISAGPLSLPTNGNHVCYIRAFAAIACLANVAGEEFSSFYGNVMPGLLECATFSLERDGTGKIIGGAGGLDAIMLRGAAIEAATIIGQAVGEIENRFVQDAEKIMALILPLFETTSALIPQDQLLAASARISSVMGSSYAPFLPSVLPHLLKVVLEEADVSITDGSEAGLQSGGQTEFDEDTGTESMTVNLPGMGIKKLTLNTTQIQEKAQAIRAIYEHANAMRTSFAPFTKECVDALLPLVNFKYSPEVRTAAAQALGPVFDAACECAISSKADIHYVNISYASILLSIVQQIQLEDDDDVETLSALADTMSTICFSGYTHKCADKDEHVAILSFSEAKNFVGELVKVMAACMEKRSSMIQFLTGTNSVRLDDDQKAEYKSVLLEEAEILTGVVDSIGYTLKSLKESFVPIFEEYICPVFGPLLTVTQATDERARLAAVCLFDDCVEHCGKDAAARYSPMLTEGILQGLDDSTNNGDIELKGASVYGVAQIARHAPKSTLKNVIGSITEKLLEIASSGNEETKEDYEISRLIENASSAIAALTLFQNSPFSNVPGAQKRNFMSIFLQNLPIREDEDEAKHCHEGFCELIESGVLDLPTHAPLLINVIGEVIASVEDGEEIASEETCQRMAQILRHMQDKIDGKILQEAFSGLSLEAQNGISVIMQ